MERVERAIRRFAWNEGRSTPCLGWEGLGLDMLHIRRGFRVPKSVVRVSSRLDIGCRGVLNWACHSFWKYEVAGQDVLTMNYPWLQKLLVCTIYTVTRNMTHSHHGQHTASKRRKWFKPISAGVHEGIILLGARNKAELPTTLPEQQKNTKTFGFRCSDIPIDLLVSLSLWPKLRNNACLP